MLIDIEHVESGAVGCWSYTLGLQCEMKFSAISLLVFSFGMIACSVGDTARVPSLHERFVKTWPSESDLIWFDQAKGKSEKEVVGLLGPPTRKEIKGGGGERWFYPWTAAAFVDFREGIAVSTFYTAGY